MKGILLAGGAGTRLAPLTDVTCKQLLPVYDKPMIYYSLTTLILTGAKEILIISTPEATPLIERVLGDGSRFGIKLSYCVQDAPNGIAEAFLLGENFINGDNITLALGDNIYYGAGLAGIFQRSAALTEGAVVFCTQVRDPQRFGVIENDENGKVKSIIEKPKNPPTNYAVTGLYMYDKNVVEYTKSLKPSARGELEITDLNNVYIKKGLLKAELMGRGNMWMDVGTHDALLNAANFIKAIDERQGLKIGCPEEAAWRMKYISDAQLLETANSFKSDSEYGIYLKNLLPAEFFSTTRSQAG